MNLLLSVFPKGHLMLKELSLSEVRRLRGCMLVQGCH
jgi:hypothetical protein